MSSDGKFSVVPITQNIAHWVKKQSGEKRHLDFSGKFSPQNSCIPWQSEPFRQSCRIDLFIITSDPVHMQKTNCDFLFFISQLRGAGLWKCGHYRFVPYRKARTGRSLFQAAHKERNFFPVKRVYKLSGISPPSSRNSLIAKSPGPSPPGFSFLILTETFPSSRRSCPATLKM